MTEHLHADDGIRLLTATEDVFAAGTSVREPWVGFMHQMPRQHLRFPDLERVMRLPAWQDSLRYCQGLYVLSSYLRDFLRSSGVGVPVCRVMYPVPMPPRRFSMARYRMSDRPRLLMPGEFLRNFQAFYDLRADGHHKQLLRTKTFDDTLPWLRTDDSVDVLDRVTDDEYDDLLTDSVVFLNLLDAGANTTIVECMLRETPLLVNRIGGVAEYLGEGYPLYYETLDEAGTKLRDPGLIEAAHQYLRTTPTRERLTGDAFLSAVTESAIYRQLPTPPSQQSVFRQVDVSVVICSYRRTEYLADLLERFALQDFDGTFEVLLWNNNAETTGEVEAICATFRDRLALRLIQSGENFLCMARLAVAPLVRGEVVLICDDDVLPAPGYITGFLRKYAAYGPDAILCARGHRFMAHELDEEQPQRVWERHEHLRFYDEAQPDMAVHFMHADNCLIPRYLLREAVQFRLPHPELALVDDYWLSFVFSKRLRVPIWKVQADTLLAFTKSADDPDVAMFHSPAVHEQRVRFYVWHMRQGWPEASDAG